VEGALRTKPDVFVIGTGYDSVMRVSRKTIDRIAAQGIDVKVERTSNAVMVYNDLQGTRTVIAAFHITY
jgi:hypothetical protein